MSRHIDIETLSSWYYFYFVKYMDYLRDVECKNFRLNILRVHDQSALMISVCFNVKDSQYTETPSIQSLTRPY